MEILRKKELKYMKELILSNPHGKYLITGPAGSGKTFFINLLGQELREAGMKIEPMPTRATIYSMDRKSFFNRDLDSFYLCDGLDEIYHPGKIYEWIQDSANGFVCTARKRDFDIKFDYELQLKSLGSSQLSLIIYDLLSGTSSNDNIKNYLNNLIKEYSSVRNKYYVKYEDTIYEGFSLQLLEYLISRYVQEKGFDEVILKSLLADYQLYRYGEKISLHKAEIIVPEKKIIKVPAELKNDISVVNVSLLERVLNNPQSLYEMTPRQFEELVCELFQKKGYNVQLTKQTGDGGKDIIVLNNDFLGDFIIYAECKRYAKTRPVGVSLVRQLYGAVEADKATAGIMVTTSTFTKGAREFRNSVPGRMSLMDYTELMKQIILFK